MGIFMGYVSFRVGMPLSFCFQEKHSQKIAESYSYPSGVCSFSIAFLLFLVGVMLKLKTFSPPNIPAFTKIGKKKAGGLPCPAVNLGRVNFPRQLKERYDNFKEAFEAFDPRFGLAIDLGFQKNCSVTRIRGGNSNEFSFHFQP